MTPMDQGRKDEDPQDAAPKSAAEKPAKDELAPPKKPAGLNYVFKIAPANPKNTFDFEDTADK